MGAVVYSISIMVDRASVTHRLMLIRKAHAAHHWGGAEIPQTIVNVRDAKISEV